MKRQYFWLNANPYQWSFHKTVVGEPEDYSIYNEEGNKRFSFKCFKEAKVGDIIIGYQSHTSKKILAIFKVAREVVDPTNFGECIFFTKYIDLPVGITRQEIKDHGFTNIMPMRDVKGSLFPLDEKDYLGLLKLIEEKNPDLLKGYYNNDLSLAEKIEALNVPTAIKYAKEKGTYYLGWNIPVGKVFTKEEVKSELMINNPAAGYRTSHRDSSLFLIVENEYKDAFEYDSFVTEFEIETEDEIEGEPVPEDYGSEKYVHVLLEEGNGNYKYMGIAEMNVEEELIEKPKGGSSKYRYLVSIFGKIVSDETDVEIPDETYIETEESEKRENSTFTREITSKVYNRSLEVSEYAKKKAKGICQLCGKPAPFLDKQGKPYLESHHVIWLSRGGEDSIHNVVGLCPNCHSKMHVVDDPEDVKKLEELLSEK